MWLTKVSILRPVTIVMFFAAVMVLGIRSMREMQVEYAPKVDLPYVMITTVYPGASPEVVETRITDPIEEAVSSVSNVRYVTSTSQYGVSFISIEFEIGTDLDLALSDVREKVDAAMRNLPRDLKEKPVITKLDIAAQPVLMVGVTSTDRSMRELKHIADEVIQDKLQQVSGVASVSVVGGEDREIRVALDKRRLEAYGLTVTDVARALGAQNLEMPAGRVREPAQEFSIRLLGEFKSVEQMRSSRLHFPSQDGGAPLKVYLNDLGTIEDTIAEKEFLVRMDGKDSVTIVVQKNADANTVDVVNGVKGRIDSLKREFPDLNFTYAQDQSKDVLDSQHELQIHLTLAIILVIVVVFAFLHTLKGTFIVSLAIPTALIATFIPMYFLGFTLNFMTMLGLALVVGILVDDAIVVLENIYRHLKMGEAPKEAAFNGRTEVGLAAITITMSDVVVFVPVAFMGGIVGQFFKEFGLTVAFATFFSLLVSFTLTPMLASTLYRRGEDLEAKGGVSAALERLYKGLDRLYRSFLGWALKHRAIVIFTGFAVLFLMLFGFGRRLGFAFIPVSDVGQLGITVETAPGTSLWETDKIVSQVERIVHRIPEVKRVSTLTGRVSGGFLGAALEGSNYAIISIDLIDKEGLLDKLVPQFFRHKKLRTRSDEAIASQLRQQLALIPGADVKVATVRGWAGTQAPVQIELRGHDTTELTRLAYQIRDTIAKIPGIISPDISWRVGKPEVQIEIDRLKASELGYSVAQIAQVMRDSVEGNTDYKYREMGDEYDIRVQLSEFDRNSVESVSNLLIGHRNGSPILLKDVATVRMGTGPTRIERKQRERQVTVLAYLAPTLPLGNAQLIINKAIKDIHLGSVKLHWAGEAERLREDGMRMLSALALASILVYVLMAALFESLFIPFVIMFSLPMALVGGILGLVLTETTLSIVAMIGFIMLVGLVTKNAILLVDYTNTLRKRGMERDAALQEACPTRLRPILMTTLSIMFGLLPLSLKLGPGAEQRAPLAVVVEGGLALSTLLTLVVIPCMYSVFDDGLQRMKRLLIRK